MTKRQKERERIAKLCDQINKNSQGAKHIRAINRRIDKKKGMKQ